MTFEEFTATREHAERLSDLLGDRIADYDADCAGVVYCDNFYIVQQESGSWLLTVDRDVYEASTFEELEQLLYDWLCAEGLI